MDIEPFFLENYFKLYEYINAENSEKNLVMGYSLQFQMFYAMLRNLDEVEEYHTSHYCIENLLKTFDNRLGNRKEYQRSLHRW